MLAAPRTAVRPAARRPTAMAIASRKPPAPEVFTPVTRKCEQIKVTYIHRPQVSCPGSSYVRLRVITLISSESRKSALH